MSSAIHGQDPIRDAQVLVVRPVVHFARSGVNDWAVWIGAKRCRLLGSTAERVLPLLRTVLDGQRGVAAVAGYLEQACGVRAEVAREGLQCLYDWEIIDDAGGYQRFKAVGAAQSAQEGFFALFSSRPSFNQATLADTHIAIATAGRKSPPLRSVLEACGLSVSTLDADHCEGVDFVVAWGYALGSAELDAVNRVCIRRRIPLLPVSTDAEGGDLGPLVLPRESACVVCAVDHLGEGTAFGRESVALARAQHRSSVAGILAHLAALEVLRFAAPCLRPSLDGRRQRYDADTHCLGQIELGRRPRCPACGDLARHSPSIVFQERGVASFGS